MAGKLRQNYRGQPGRGSCSYHIRSFFVVFVVVVVAVEVAVGCVGGAHQAPAVE